MRRLPRGSALAAGVLAVVAVSLTVPRGTDRPSATGLAAASGPAAPARDPGPAAYLEDPPTAHTGGFGEPTCEACHFGQPVNEPEGDLGLEGLPATGSGPSGRGDVTEPRTAGVAGECGPEEAVRLAVVLRRSGMERAGFQLSVRFAGGEREGTQAGRLEAADGRAEVTPDEESDIRYAHHTPDGTEPVAPDSARWELEWSPPEVGAAAGSTAVFHVAANAANDDRSEFGDFIYADEFPVDLPLAGCDSRR